MPLPKLPFDVYIIYAFIGAIAAFLISVIRNRTVNTSYKSTIDKSFTAILSFFIVFCLFDSAWGLIGSFFAKDFPQVYEISSYIFHILSAISSFACSYYGVHYLKIDGTPKKVIDTVRIIILVCQLGLIFQNFFTHSFFEIVMEDTINEVGDTITKGTYLPGVMRQPAFLIQFCQYLPLAIASLVAGFKNYKHKRIRTNYFSGFFFLLIPLVFGVLQMFYPDGPFYSCGFAVASIVIYSFNVTTQREEYLAEFHKIEEQKKMQESIMAAIKSAEEANQARSKFLSNMSHDIRTPINGIMGLTSLLCAEEMSDKAKEYVGKINSASNHLLSLVNDVLDMSLFDNKEKTVIAQDAINIKGVINNCESIIGGQVLNRQLKFKVKYINEIKHAEIFGDALRLRQIFVNILGNSVKFTHDGGEINFTIEEIESTDEIVTFRFMLSDTGIGMSEEFISHIFEPFTQDNSGARTQYQGTGLGMSITKQLVDFMNGKIEVVSKKNKGTTFTLTIPFKINKDFKIVTKEIEETVFDANGIRCLLVEDNELNMEIAQTIFESKGMVVTTAVDGSEAVEIFSKSDLNSFDIIFMDIMMPIMNGYDATVKIRSLERPDAKTTPIFAMTANAFDEDKKKAILSGMNGHIAKPIDFNRLIKEIGKFVKKS